MHASIPENLVFKDDNIWIQAFPTTEVSSLVYQDALEVS